MTLLVMTLFASVACGSSRWMSLPHPSSFDHSDRRCFFMGSGFGFLTGRYAVRNHSRLLFCLSLNTLLREAHVLSSSLRELRVSSFNLFSATDLNTVKQTGCSACLRPETRSTGWIKFIKGLQNPHAAVQIRPSPLKQGTYLKAAKGLCSRAEPWPLLRISTEVWKDAKNGKKANEGAWICVPLYNPRQPN